MRRWKTGAGRAQLARIIMLAALGLAASCSEGPLDPGPTPFMRGDADGAVWEADDLPRSGWAVSEVNWLPDGSRALTLRGVDRREYGQVEIWIRVADYHGPGTYPLGNPDSGSWAVFKTVALDGTIISWYRTDHAEAGDVIVETDMREGEDFGVPLHGISGGFRFSARKFDGQTYVTADNGAFRGRYHAHPR